LLAGSYCHDKESSSECDGRKTYMVLPSPSNTRKKIFSDVKWVSVLKV
jgi:hypothetical protein